VEDGGGGSWSQNITIPDDSTGWTYTQHIKKESLTITLRFGLFDGSEDRDVEISFDASTGSFSGAGGTQGDIKVEDVGDYWRVSITVNNNGSGNTRATIFLKDVPASGITVDGRQLENHHAVATDGNGYADATHATMPILTGGATRSEDRLVMPIWWPSSLDYGGYLEASQFSGNNYDPGAAHYSDSFFGVGPGPDIVSYGQSLLGYDRGIATAIKFDGSNFRSGGNKTDGKVRLAANASDVDNPVQLNYLYIDPDFNPSNVAGPRFIYTRTFVWSQELTEGSGGQLESLFNYDFSV